jgi:hypothetical protein
MRFKRQDIWERLQKLENKELDTIRQQKLSKLRKALAVNNSSLRDPNPSGLCLCGCGQKTTIQKYDNKQQGIRAGCHRCFCHGHFQAVLKLLDPKWGRQFQRQELREIKRGLLVKTILSTNGLTSLEEIRRAVAPEFELEGCSRMVNSAREWGYVVGERKQLIWLPEIPRIIVRYPRQTRPPYERPDIPNERETEIPLLTKSRFIKSLDESFGDDDRTGYYFIPSNTLTPLELLLLKEDIESEENKDREQRIVEWNRWVERRQSVFSDIFIGA